MHPRESAPSNGISIASTVLQGSPVCQTERRTDRQTSYTRTAVRATSVAIARIKNYPAFWRCELKVKKTQENLVSFIAEISALIIFK